MSIRPLRIAILLAATLALLAILTARVAAEPVVSGNLLVNVQGALTPKALPRDATAPVTVSLAGQIATTDGTPPPALSRLRIAINRHGRLDATGLPTCSRSQIQPTTTANALAACRDALVGEGSFSASVAIPESSPYPSQGRLLAFNATDRGRPALLAHIYGTQPLATSLTLPITVSRGSGQFGARLTLELPDVDSNIAFVTGLSLRLHRTYRYRGRSRSYLSASCPALEGTAVAPFTLLRAGFEFATGALLSTDLRRSCRVRPSR